MPHAQLAEPPVAAGTGAETSLETIDAFEPATSRTYCPAQLLATFSLLMAGHGRCVSTAMMLGDKEYAMWQLARARTLPDEELCRVAERLFAYFDDARLSRA